MLYCTRNGNSEVQKDARSRLQKLEAYVQADLRKHGVGRESEFVQNAIRHPFTWVTEYTESFNQHWQVEGRPSPNEHFPKYDYFHHIFDIFDAERIVWIEKSRDLMVSFSCPL
jgi:hypothetical protein